MLTCILTLVDEPVIDPRQVPSNDRYVRKEMFNGEICELEEPRKLHDMVSGRPGLTLGERFGSVVRWNQLWLLATG